MSYVNHKLRKSAQGKPCTMLGPTCTGGGEERNDVCLRHSNQLEHGKGVGMKAHDLLAFYGCQNCEDWYSGRESSPSDKAMYFAFANQRTLVIACNEGVFK